MVLKKVGLVIASASLAAAVALVAAAIRHVTSLSSSSKSTYRLSRRGSG